MARIGRAFPARPIIKRAVPSGANPNVTVAITGVSGTGAVGTITPSTTVALTGVAGTGAVGTLGVSFVKAITGVSGTGAVGTMTPATAVAITGISGTGAVGTVGVIAGGDVTVALTGVQGTGQVGSVSTSGGDAVATPNVGGGKPSRRRHYVEIDGQYFEVRDHAQAVQILTKLHEAAKETAAAAAKAAVVKAKSSPKAVAPEVVVPRMAVVKPDYSKEFVQQLQAQVDATNAQIAETYKAALAAAVAWQRNLDDEEEIMMLFAAGIL